jgi:hypothetical protein
MIIHLKTCQIKNAFNFFFKFFNLFFFILQIIFWKIQKQFLIFRNILNLFLLLADAFYFFSNLPKNLLIYIYIYVSYFFILGDSSFPKILEPLTNFFEIKKLFHYSNFPFSKIIQIFL